MTFASQCPETETETDDLIRLAGRGDAAARQRLLALHRERLRRMVEVRLDPRVAARLDASDVVQEALIDAAGGLDDYLRAPPLPFYPWLRQFAWERLAKLHEHHLAVQKRSAARERPLPPLSDASASRLAECLVASATSPSRRLVREEEWGRARSALDLLGARDRETLVLLYLEGLANREAAAVLGIGEGALKMRHVRALQRLRTLMGPDPSEVAS